MKRFYSIEQIMTWASLFVQGPCSVLKRAEHNYDLVYELRLDPYRAAYIDPLDQVRVK